MTRTRIDVSEKILMTVISIEVLFLRI